MHQTVVKVHRDAGLGSATLLNDAGPLVCCWGSSLALPQHFRKLCPQASNGSQVCHELSADQGSHSSENEDTAADHVCLLLTFLGTALVFNSA